MRFILVVFILLTCNGLVEAQKSRKEIKGDKYFNRLAYKTAVSKYEEADNLTDEGLRNLAICHLKIRNFAAAEKEYAQFMSLNKYNDEDIYNFASILEANEKYDDAELWMKQFAEKNPADNRSKDFLSNGKNVLNLLKDEGRYKISNASVNSENQDFGPAYWNEKLVFASNSREIGPVKKSYSWNGKPYLDIYVADISSDGSLKEAHSVNRYHKNSINKNMHEGPVCFARKGNLMAFTRNNYVKRSEQEIHKLEIYFAEFKNGVWQNETSFKLNNSEYSVGHPWLSEDGNTMYFASDMPGGFGATDIYKIERTEGSEWGEPINLGDKINTVGDEMFPFYQEQKSLFMFASNAHTGLGGLDLFLVYAPKHKMGKLINMGTPLNSSFDDFAVIADPEMKKGFFSSNREGGKGDDDIYMVEFLKPFIFTKTVEGVVYNKDTVIRDGAIITLFDEAGNKIAETIADANGKYSFEIENLDVSYYIESKKDEFEPGKTQKIDISGPSEVIKADVVMEKKPVFGLLCTIKEKDNFKLVSGAKIKIVDKDKGTVVELTSTDKGEIAKLLEGYKVNSKTNLEIVVEKEGYTSKTVPFVQLLDRSGTYKLEIILEPAQKLEVGEDLADLFKINPIYFDYDKFNIRKDAAIELDKIVEIMNKYPNLVIELGSHTDCRGTAQYNQKLSDSRAKSSAAYIASKITNPDRIYGIGYGEYKLTNGCACEGTKQAKCSEEEHQLNRRTEFIIVGKDGLENIDKEKLELMKKNANFMSGSSSSNSVSTGKALVWNNKALIDKVAKSDSAKKEKILIVGSFKNSSMADLTAKALDKNGFKVYQEDSKLGFIRVGAYVYVTDEAEAELLKKDFTKNFPPEVWYLTKK
jgi:outer membrane protein OmpA-like peptidoglycan-associated protein/bisphosphoglycerate-dependent phosphoglycerate mutase